MGKDYLIRGLCAGYHDVEALHGVTASLRAGQVTSLIGPNGCGKSTLLRVLGGLLPYRGSVRIGETEVRDLRRGDLGVMVGMVPQQTLFSQEFSVYDVILMGRLPHKRPFSRTTPEDERIACAAAEQAGIAHLLFRSVAALSGGEQQRVSIAMVLAQTPDIYLFDEPTASLDPNHSVKVFQMMRELAARGETVVAAVHDVNFAAAYSDGYIAMKEGRTLASGAVSEIEASLLERLYETPFLQYASSSGSVAWHAGEAKR